MKHIHSEFIKAWLEGKTVYFRPLNSKVWQDVRYLSTFDSKGLKFSFKATDNIDKLLEEFDFNKVQAVMMCLDWSYFDTNGVPSIPKLKDTAENLLNLADKERKETDKKTYTVSSGGFEATAYVDSEGIHGYELKFIVEQHNYYES